MEKNDQQRETALIVQQILPTNTTRKCMENSKENVYLNTESRICI